jgi:hypothetical protein
MGRVERKGSAPLYTPDSELFIDLLDSGLENIVRYDVIHEKRYQKIE